MGDILETAATELGQALGTSRALVRVGLEELQSQAHHEALPQPELAAQGEEPTGQGEAGAKGSAGKEV